MKHRPLWYPSMILTMCYPVALVGTFLWTRKRSEVILPVSNSLSLGCTVSFFTMLCNMLLQPHKNGCYTFAWKCRRFSRALRSLPETFSWQLSPNQKVFHFLLKSKYFGRLFLYQSVFRIPCKKQLVIIHTLRHFLQQFTLYWYMHKNIRNFIHFYDQIIQRIIIQKINIRGTKTYHSF